MRVKQAFGSQDNCVKAWISRQHEFGYSGGKYRTMTFKGPTIFNENNFGHALATFQTGDVVLVRTDREDMDINSYRRPTIRFHLKHSGLKYFNVPGVAIFKSPVEVLVHMVERYIDLMMKAKRARERFQGRIQDASEYKASLIRYANEFDLDIVYPEGCAKLENFLLYRAAKLSARGMAEMMGRG